jgi:hypothetical protein
MDSAILTDIGTAIMAKLPTTTSGIKVATINGTSIATTDNVWQTVGEESAGGKIQAGCGSLRPIVLAV